LLITFDFYEKELLLNFKNLQNKAKISYFDSSISSKTKRLTAKIVKEKLENIPFS